MEDTPLGQMLLERGIEKGRPEGQALGRTEDARRLLERLAQRRFGARPAWLIEWALAQTDPEALERALEQLMEAPSLEDLRRSTIPA